MTLPHNGIGPDHVVEARRMALQSTAEIWRGLDTAPARTVDGLRLRKRLGRNDWQPPVPFGPDGWHIRRVDDTASVIVTACDWDGTEWIHASIAGDAMPTYDNLVALHRAAFGDGYAYQVFAPASQHVNIHAHALHLWGRADDQRCDAAVIDVCRTATANRKDQPVPHHPNRHRA